MINQVSVGNLFLLLGNDLQSERIANGGGQSGDNPFPALQGDDRLEVGAQGADAPLSEVTAGPARVAGLYDERGALVGDRSSYSPGSYQEDLDAAVSYATSSEVPPAENPDGYGKGLLSPERLQIPPENVSAGSGLLAPERLQLPPETGNGKGLLSPERTDLTTIMKEGSQGEENGESPASKQAEASQPDGPENLSQAVRGEIRFEISSDGRERVIVEDPRTGKVIREVPPDKQQEVQKISPAPVPDLAAAAAPSGAPQKETNPAEMFVAAPAVSSAEANVSAVGKTLDLSA